MQDGVYRVVIRIFRGLFRVLAIRFDIRGAEHLPASGPAVIASNHISYLDFTFIGLAADHRGRKVRFLAKGSVFRLPVVGSLMRAMGHVPVERASVSGAGAYRHAERAVQLGEIVGVFPEATISRAWTLKPFKRGAAALAVEQDVPLIPVITWGGQRLITVDGRRHFLRHVPVTVLIGPPIPPQPELTVEEFTDVLHAVMEQMLDGVQRDYPDRPRNLRDTWWLPRHLGGGAPGPAEAALIDEARIQR